MAGLSSASEFCTQGTSPHNAREEEGSPAASCSTSCSTTLCRTLARSMCQLATDPHNTLSVIVALSEVGRAQQVSLCVSFLAQIEQCYWNTL